MNQKTYQTRRANGLCVDCGMPATPGFVRCEKCRPKHMQYQANYIKGKRKKNSNLQETMKAADAAGMTYGQYVALNSEGMKWRITKGNRG